MRRGSEERSPTLLLSPTIPGTAVELVVSASRDILMSSNTEGAEGLLNEAFHHHHTKNSTMRPPRHADVSGRMLYIVMPLFAFEEDPAMIESS